MPESETQTPTGENPKQAVDDEAGSQLDNAVGDGESTEKSEDTRQMPDKAYQGLQRRIGAKDEELAELRRQNAELLAGKDGDAIENMRTQGQALIDRMRGNPETAGQVDQAQALLEGKIAAMERDQLAGVLQSRDTANAQEIEEGRMMVQLRAMVVDIGADPDSPLIDYGSDNLPTTERMDRVRESSKSSIKPVKDPVKEVPGTEEDGSAHNTQPGVISRGNEDESGEMSQGDYTAILLEYQRHPSEGNKSKMDVAVAARVAQQEEALKGVVG